MRKIGIVGGVAWPSTVEYYSGLCRLSERLHRSQDRSGAISTPEIVIESLDLRKAVSYLGIEGDDTSWTRFDRYHREALARLEASGARIALMASNTPHHRFQEIVSGIGICVLNIFETAAAAGVRAGGTDILVLGTPQTMRSSGIRDAFADKGLCARGPRDNAVVQNMGVLIAKLQAGERAGTAKQLGMIVEGELRSGGYGAKPMVCLACTELPLAFLDHENEETFEADGVVYIDTSAAHINAAFAMALN